MPESRLVTVTLTPSTTAPVASVTVPRISPEFVFCANPLVTLKAKRQTARTARDTLHIYRRPPRIDLLDLIYHPANKEPHAKTSAPDRSRMAIQGTTDL